MAYKKRMGREMSEIIPDDQEMGGGSQDFAYQDGGASNGGASKGLVKFVVVILIVLVVIAGAWYALDKYTGLNLPGLGSEETASSDWQAIFLSNGQVYFGKVKSMNKENLILTDIYYLQVVNKPLQQSQAGATDAAAQQELTLAKLGNEIHGPVDAMTINRDHILLTEGLKNDSKVVTAINKYVEDQKQK